MSKKIRVENADCGSTKIAIEIWEEDRHGNARLRSLRHLTEPTDMIEFEIFENQFLIIKGEQNERKD